MATANKPAADPQAPQPNDDPNPEALPEEATGPDPVADTGASAGDGTDPEAERQQSAAAPLSREALEQELETQRRLVAGQREATLRVQAEMENLRKRSARELEKAHRYALEGFIGDLLPVKDSMELGLSAAAEEGTDVAHVRDGLALTLKMFEQAVQKFGLVEVDPLGEVFNPDFHQAMTMQESADAESGTVTVVVQKGYLLNQRLIRPAMVIVAK